MTREWFRFENKAGSPASADLYIFDEIGKSYVNDDAVTAKQFITDLRALPDSVKTIRVHINSPGGNPFEATAIANAMRAERTDRGRQVEVRIDGLAASAASIIAMAGRPIRIADNAMMMIHDPSAVAMGNSTLMREMADTLDAIRDSIVSSYQWNTKLGADDLIAAMKNTTWYDADEAIAAGFAHEKIEGLRIAASLSPEIAASLAVHSPDRFKARIAALVREVPAVHPSSTVGTSLSAAATLEVLALCEAKGCIEIASELVKAGATVEQVHARIVDVTAAKAATVVREREIRALCRIGGVPNLGDAFVSGGMSVAHVKAAILAVGAYIDAAIGEIDTTLPPAGYFDNGAHKRNRYLGHDVMGDYERLNQGGARDVAARRTL